MIEMGIAGTTAVIFLLICALAVAASFWMGAHNDLRHAVKLKRLQTAKLSDELRAANERMVVMTARSDTIAHALQPFAAEAQYWNGSAPDRHISEVRGTLSVSHLRAARKALQE